MKASKTNQYNQLHRQPKQSNTISDASNQNKAQNKAIESVTPATKTKQYNQLRQALN